HGRFVKLAVRVTNRTPVVDRRGLCISQRRSDDIEVWKLGNSAFDHAEETAHVEFRVMLVLAVDFESKRGREVLFVTKHHINQRRQFAVHVNRLLLPANRLPKRFAIVEIVRHYGSVFTRDFHRLARDRRRRLRQRAEEPARVKPARAFRTEDLFPIDVAGFQFRNRSVTAIGATGSRTNAETAFSKVETIANSPAYTVELHPLHVRLVHAALINQILDQAANRVISQRGHDRCVHAKAALQSASDVVLTTTFPNTKAARGGDTSFARIQTQHYLTKTHDVPATVCLRLHRQKAHTFVPFVATRIQV